MEQKRDDLLCELSAKDSINFNIFSGKNADINEIIRLSQTLPFIGEKRTILLEETGVLKGRSNEELLECFSKLSESTVVILFESDIDKNTKLYKLIKKEGNIFECDGADIKDLRKSDKIKAEIRRWAVAKLKVDGLNIGSRELEHILELCGYDMTNLETELEKLCCYKLHSRARIVTRQDIDDICSRSVSDRVFEMISAKLLGDIDKALRLCNDLLSIKVPVGRILYLLERQFNNIYILKDMQRAGRSDAEIAKAASLSDWQLRRLKKEASSLSLAAAFYYLSLSVELETKIKTGEMPDKVALEILLSS